MKCLVNGLEVMYPCSNICPLYGDCVTAFDALKKSRVRTNADRIRAMSDEELAKFLAKLDPRCSNCPADDICTGCSSEKGCVDWFQDWLRQPVKDGDTDG